MTSLLRSFAPEPLELWHRCVSIRQSLKLCWIHSLGNLMQLVVFIIVFRSIHPQISRTVVPTASSLNLGHVQTILGLHLRCSLHDVNSVLGLKRKCKHLRRMSMEILCSGVPQLANQKIGKAEQLGDIRRAHIPRRNCSGKLVMKQLRIVATCFDCIYILLLLHSEPFTI